MSAELCVSMGNLIDEFRSIVLKNQSLMDVLILPVIFSLLLFFVDFFYAGISVFVLSVVWLVFRLFKQQQTVYLVVGIGVTAFSFLLSFVNSSPSLFFLPGIVQNGLLFLVAITSIVLKKPLVAWTSHLTRKWPINWYWHEKVRPAYAETTMIWVGYFFLQLGIELWVYSKKSIKVLTVIRFIHGWPSMVILLIVSYLYGMKRLKQLKGPSVEEFKKKAKPPWSGQEKGF